MITISVWLRLCSGLSIRINKDEEEGMSLGKERPGMKNKLFERPKAPGFLSVEYFLSPKYEHDLR